MTKKNKIQDPITKSIADIKTLKPIPADVKDIKNNKPDIGDVLLYKIFIEMLPCLIITVAVFYFLVESIGYKFDTTKEQYKIFIGGIGISATLSALSYTASSNSLRNKRKRFLFQTAGERFLFSVFIFIIILIYHYALSSIKININILKNSLFALNIVKLYLLGVGLAILLSGFINLKNGLIHIKRMKNFRGSRFIQRKFIYLLKIFD